jgi:hypothetical protein
MVCEDNNDQENACIAYENSLHNAIELRGERDIVLANIWVSLAAVREGCGDINGAIAAREKVEFLFHDFQEPNDDHKEQREINQTGLMRLYSLVDK